MQAFFSKPLLATLLIALGFGLTACSEPDGTSSGAATSGEGESASVSIDTDDNAASYESGGTSISVNAEDDESSDTQ